MSKRIYLLCISFLSMFLVACSSNSGQQGNEGTNGNHTLESTKDFPILSVITDDGKNDFATEPLNGYVAEQIASWTPDYVAPPEPYYSDCKISLSGAGNRDNFEFANAKIKVRGNWTTNYDKKPFRIDFEEKRNLLGLNNGHKFKTWVLLADYKDMSMLRNKIALEMSKAILSDDNLYASDAEFVNLYINNEYWGVYLVAEYQQINKDRVNITKNMKDYTGVDIGYFFEFDGYFTNEEPIQQFHVSYHQNAPIKGFNGDKDDSREIRCLPQSKYDDVKDVGFTIKNDIMSEQQHDFIESYMEDVYWIMYEAAYNNAAYVFNNDYSDIMLTNDISPKEAVERVVNINSLADMYIISELTCDADLYWSSFYMTVDFGPSGDRKLTFQAPWDFDSALGNKSRCTDGTGFYAASIIPDVNGDEYETINPWLAVLIHQNWYQDIIRTKWKKIYGSGLFENIYNLIENYKINYEDDFQMNIGKWGLCSKNPDINRELSPKAKKCLSQTSAADQLETWLKARVEFLNGYWGK